MTDSEKYIFKITQENISFIPNRIGQYDVYALAPFPMKVPTNLEINVLNNNNAPIKINKNTVFTLFQGRNFSGENFGKIASFNVEKIGAYFIKVGFDKDCRENNKYKIEIKSNQESKYSILKIVLLILSVLFFISSIILFIMILRFYN